MPWRYEPKDNRTPVNHPVIGHLEYGQVYDNPLCANDPNFVAVKNTKVSKPSPEAPVATPAADDIPADAKSVSESPAKQTSAGKPGRS